MNTLKKILFQNRTESGLVPYLWLAAGYLYDLWYQIVPGKWILDSDLAAEMVLANKLNAERSILSTDWFYSTELKVFHSQWFYRLGLLFFPDNWHRARILAVSLMLALFVALLLWFAEMAGLKKYGAWCAAFMMWPFGNWYLVYGIFGTHYLIYIFFSLSVFSIVMKLYEKYSAAREGLGKHDIIINGRVLLCVAGCLISFASGLNGVRQLMVFFAPFLMAVTLLLYFEIREKNATSMKEIKTVCSRELAMFVCGILFTLCSTAGYLVNSSILSKRFAFRSYNDIVWKGPARGLYDVWFDFLRLYGFQRDVKLVSFGGLAAALSLVLSICVLISMIRLCMRYQTLGTGTKLTLLLTISTLLINGLIFCLAEIDYKEYYWLSLLPFGAALLVAEIQTEHFVMEASSRKIALFFMMICITICSFSTVKKELEIPLLPIRRGYNQVADYLVENGLTQGYSSFWSAAVLREMSNGAIETWTIYNGTTLHEWLQEKNHTTRQPQKPYFFLYDTILSGEREWYTMLCDGSGRLIYQNDSFEIYIYE